MNDPTERDARIARNVVIALGIVLGLLMILLGSGCSSCPPCEPVVKVETIKVPVTVYPHMDVPAPVPLPEWPEQPPEGAPPEAWKAWYADMAAVARERMELLKNRVESLERVLRVLEAHNGEGQEHQ